MSLHSGNKSKPLSVNSLRVSQTVGGVLALQGFYRSLPVIYGAHGCAETIRQLLSLHYREPIALQNIALQDSNLIFGAGDQVREVIDLAMSRYKPDLIVLIGTSLTEVVGDDLENDVRVYIKEHSGKKVNCQVLSLQMPDYDGSLETGYARMTERILERVLKLPGVNSGKKHRNRINLLAGPHLTPGDVMEIKDIISSFGLEVITFPDISSALCGHLLIGHTPLSRGGAPLDYLNQIITSGVTIAVGSCMEAAARRIEQETGIPYYVFQSLTGLEASDEFFSLLMQQSRSEVQVKYRWQRQILLDGMLDSRNSYRGKRVIAALEPDHLVGISDWLAEMGVQSFQAVAPAMSPVLDKIKGKVQIGDLEDMERLAGDGADLWIGNSNSEQGAWRQGIAFESMGFPIFNKLGTSLSVSVGYRGTTEILNRLGNTFLASERRWPE